MQAYVHRPLGATRRLEGLVGAVEAIDTSHCETDVEALVLESKREAPRVPFGSLVERGLIQPGEVLSDQSGRWRARVRADGSLISAEHRGSIHAVGARVQGAPACNGWAFWHVERKGAPVPIDWFRQQVRAELGGGAG